MENIDFATLFQGFGTMMESGYLLASARVFLILLGLLLIYLGWKGVLEPMVMIPMGLGMVAINCGTLFMPCLLYTSRSQQEYYSGLRAAS